MLRFKDDVTLTPNAAGARLLGSIERVARTWPTDIIVSCGSDSHPPKNPHTRGCAFDVRTHGLLHGDKELLIVKVMIDVRDGGEADVPLALSDVSNFNRATARYFGQLEKLDLPDEHAHFQLRNGKT